LHLKLGRLPDTPPATSSTQPSSSGPADDKGLTCLRFVPTVGMTVAVACEEQAGGFDAVCFSGF
jgi:hypothetical protein